MSVRRAEFNSASWTCQVPGMDSIVPQKCCEASKSYFSDSARRQGKLTAIETVPGGGGEGLGLDIDGERGLGDAREAEGPAAGPLTPGVLPGAMPVCNIEAQHGA